ncbi:hypothetical protein H310_14679 [Aphanomyces invadans]|uniref:Uncharacterized protein n=1 Tax=Aphanomyces invadans TaxID=157072 RepID=A0A024T985_9STRA|nr:hypothetical protein H310_14679 [Aphanomyces invadans]ETV90554.1 hypothetical protein H310_14679 [Aphanomyces invadans]|eukprot:XP_008880804.1 hypothetical protein H310_14679 [Aphanomyces invadans]
MATAPASITPPSMGTSTTPTSTVFTGTASGASSPVVQRVAQTFFKFVQSMSMFEPDPMTPREFLTDFYTERNLPEKLSDVDALVAYYGTDANKMMLLYTELDKRYGTSFAANPPCKFQDEAVRRPEAATTTTAPGTKPPVNKVILLGNSGVGKTNLLSRLAKGEFSTDFASTIGVEFLTQVMEVDGVQVKAQIWDTAGQERFHAMMSTYYRKAVGALLVFDVTDKTTFDGIQKWLDQLVQVAEPGLATVLVGNKADVDASKRAVSTMEAQAYAASHHMMYVETSAKTGANVDKAFRDLLTTVHRLQSYSRMDHGATSALDLSAKPSQPAPDSFCG